MLKPENEREEKILSEGMRIGKEHITPSPETKEAITKLTMELDYIKKDIKEIKETVKELPTITEMDLANRKLVEEVFDKVKNEYVTKEDFKPVKKIVYGLVGASLLAVLGSIFALVIR